MKKISVIIVTYNSELHIFDCLSSLFENNDIGDSLEVIIVDNCSSNFETVSSNIESLYKDRINIIRNDKNGGYGQGNNMGIKASTAPIIMIMNPDVRITTPIFSTICNKFEEKDVVMYGLRQMISETRRGLSFDCTSLLNPWFSIPLSKLAIKYDLYIQRIMYFSGACFFVRKDAFEKAGLFDEDIFMYGEEDDIHNRLLTHTQGKFIYDKKISYLHCHNLYRQPSLSLDTSYISRYRSQLIWKKKIGISESDIKKHYIKWIKCLAIKHLLISPFSHGEKKNYDAYKELINKIRDIK